MAPPITKKKRKEKRHTAMSASEVRKTMAKPLERHMGLLISLADKEYKLRLQKNLTVPQREKKVLEIQTEVDKLLDCLSNAKRRTVNVPRVCCADIINRPESVDVDVGWQEIFDISRGKSEDEVFVLQLRDLLQQGDYGFVYNAVWTACEPGKPDRKTDAVVKVAKIPSNSLWMLLEFVIHSFLMKKSTLKPFFSHLLGAAVAHKDEWPYRELFIVQAYHPGMDMYDYMNDYSFHDGTLIAIVQQIAFIIYNAQVAYRFMHRDLKVENVLIYDANTMIFPAGMPESEKELLTRPPFYICEEVQFGTDNVAVQLIDLGSSTITTDSNTTISCTTNRNPETNRYNAAADMANFCYTLFLDYEKIIAIRAPRFHAYLKAIVQPMVQHTATFPEESVDIVSHKCATADFMPAKIIKNLQVLRIGSVQRDIDNYKFQVEKAVAPVVAASSTSESIMTSLTLPLSIAFAA